MAVKVVLLPGRVLVKIRDKKGKEIKESDELKFFCVMKYKARDLVFINFDNMKNAWSLKQRVRMRTK